MSNHLTLVAALVLATSLPALGQEQPKRAPSVSAPAQPQRAVTVPTTVQCPSSISATVSPGGGWTGGTYTGTLFNVSAMDGSRTDCIYKIDYVTITKPAPAGQKCAVAADKKSFSCQ